MYDRYLRESETEFDSDEAAAHDDKWSIMKIVKDFFSWFQYRDWRVTVLDPTRCDRPDLSDVVFYVGEPQKAALVLKLNGSSVTQKLSRDGLSAIQAAMAEHGCGSNVTTQFYQMLGSFNRLADAAARPSSAKEWWHVQAAQKAIGDYMEAVRLQPRQLRPWLQANFRAGPSAEEPVEAPAAAPEELEGPPALANSQWHVKLLVMGAESTVRETLACDCTLRPTWAQVLEPMMPSLGVESVGDLRFHLNGQRVITRIEDLSERVPYPLKNAFWLTRDFREVVEEGLYEVVVEADIIAEPPPLGRHFSVEIATCFICGFPRFVQKRIDSDNGSSSYMACEACTSLNGLQAGWKVNPESEKIICRRLNDVRQRIGTGSFQSLGLFFLHW